MSDRPGWQVVLSHPSGIDTWRRIVMMVNMVLIMRARLFSKDGDFDSNLNLGNPNSAQTPLGERGRGRFQHLLVGLRDDNGLVIVSNWSEGDCNRS